MKKQSLIVISVILLLSMLCGCIMFPAELAPQSEQTFAGSGLSVHFIDVGQADCALLECDGRAMLIDGGNVKDSSLVVAYLKQREIDTLDYIVCTHAHEDHVGGLSGPLNTCTVGQVFAPVTEHESEAFQNFVKYTQKQGLSVTVPEVGSSFLLGEAIITVLGPRREYEETNNTSIVLRVDYGKTSFLFAGDMEKTAEEDLLAAGCDLSVDVLKVGHHGSDTSTGYVFLREVMPEYAVISVGKDNSYGHPHEAVVSRLRDAKAVIYRTDEQGTVVAFSDGETVQFTTETPFGSEEGQGAAKEETEEANNDEGAHVYVGNMKSQVFHREDCGGLPAEHNRILFDGRDEAVEAGFRACGSCNP